MNDEQKRNAEHAAAVEKARTALAKVKGRSILDQEFRYSNSAETDLRKSFARIRKEQRAAQIEAEKVVPIRKEKP